MTPPTQQSIGVNLRPSADRFIKAISLWQPWASCVAVGAKRIETRSWETHYRGPLLIHAAKRRVRDWMDYTGRHNAICDAMRCTGDNWWEKMAFGSIIAVCTVSRCLRTDDVPQDDVFRIHTGLDGGTWTEWNLGDFANGRFAWYLDDVRAFKTPVPYKGRQGLFNVPYEVVAN